MIPRSNFEIYAAVLLSRLVFGSYIRGEGPLLYDTITRTVRVVCIGVLIVFGSSPVVALRAALRWNQFHHHYRIDWVQRPRSDSSCHNFLISNLSPESFPLFFFFGHGRTRTYDYCMYGMTHMLYSNVKKVLRMELEWELSCDDIYSAR
jgi:hypothetical protein